MENRCLLHRIDPEKGTITLPDGKEYPLLDTKFPTIDWKKPYELTSGEKDVMERLHMPAEHLSGGQQQRLCLARALALEPSILLLDEPTASLDVHATAEVEELLRNLAERYPLIMVSHSLRQALQMGDRLLVMENGMLTHRLEGRASTTERELSGLLGVAPERLL